MNCKFCKSHFGLDSLFCGNSLAYSVPILTLPFSLSPPMSLTHAQPRQPVNASFGFSDSTNQPVTSSTPQTVKTSWRPTGISATHAPASLCTRGGNDVSTDTSGAFRTRGKTWEAGDLLGESHISFRALSLLTIHAITFTDQEHRFPSHSITTHHLCLDQHTPDLPSYTLPS